MSSEPPTKYLHGQRPRLRRQSFFTPEVEEVVSRHFQSPPSRSSYADLLALRRVPAAFFADALRPLLPRFRAVLFACRDSAARETVLFGSFFIAFSRARPCFVEPSSLVTGSSFPRRVS
jgi:hypothetical protein